MSKFLFALIFVFLFCNYGYGQTDQCIAYGFITGDRVNMRSKPYLDSRSIILTQLDYNDYVGILDKYDIDQKYRYGLTNSATHFYSDDGYSYEVIKGLACQILSSNGYYYNVKIRTESGSDTGRVKKSDISLSELSNWYKIKYRGIIGWVYSKYIRQA